MVSTPEELVQHILDALHDSPIAPELHGKDMVKLLEVCFRDQRERERLEFEKLKFEHLKDRLKLLEPVVDNYGPPVGIGMKFLEHDEPRSELPG